MIADALLLPTEHPPTAADLKRALLTFDRVYLVEPSDRDLMPDHLIPSVMMGMPLAFPTNSPVLPLGKVNGYDSAFDELIHEARAAVAQQAVQVLSPISGPNVPAPGIVIGMVPTPPGSPNFSAVYNIFRLLASHPEFVRASFRGMDIPLLLSDPDLTALAPPSLSVNGQVVEGPLPPLGFLPETVSDAEREVLGRLALARMAATVKNLGVCHERSLQPLTSDPGIAKIIDQLDHNAADVVETAAALEPEGFSLDARLLARFHNLALEEVVDHKVLDDLSVYDVLTYRDRAWGVAREARVELGRVLREIAAENPDQSKFERACTAALEAYEKAQADWLHQRANLVIRAGADLVSKTTSTLGRTGVVMSLLQALSGFASLEALIALGVLPAAVGGLASITREHLPQARDLIRAGRDSQSLPGYALSRPYRSFTTRR